MMLKLTVELLMTSPREGLPKVRPAGSQREKWRTRTCSTLLTWLVANAN